MSTIHSNSPRECISRMESMVLMGGFDIPARTIREMIVSSVDLIIQAQRLRDGSRKVTHITEVIGLEGEVVTLQDLYLYEIIGEDASGRVSGRHRTTGIARPHFWEKARYYGEDKRLTEILSAGEVLDEYGRPLGERLA
jgi:pilus assembly protein CpaF